MAHEGRIVFHYATGGFAHFLRLLENSLQWANRWGFRVVVITEPAKTLAFLSFGQLFEVVRPLPVKTLSEVEPKLLIRPNGVNVTHYFDHWGGGPCVLRFDGIEEKPRSVTFLNRLAMSPQLTIGDQKRLFPRPYDYLLPRLKLTKDFREAVSSPVASIPRDGTVGVHFRNTDSPGNLEDSLTQLASVTKKADISTVVWCSDDPHSLEKAAQAFPDLRFVEGSTKPPIQPGRDSLHGGVDNNNVDWMLKSTLIDIALLSSVEYFVPATNSAWAQLVPYFRKNPQVRDSFFGLDRT